MSWPAGKKINTHDSTPHSPAACVANLDPQDPNSSNLYLFWCGNDSKLYWSRCTSKAQHIWANGSPVTASDSSPQALSACVFKNVLHAFWKSNDTGNRFWFTTYDMTQVWVPPAGINMPGYWEWDCKWHDARLTNETACSPFAPAACVFDDQLYLFWKANDSSNSIYYSASGDGVTWLSGIAINTLDSTPSAPAACAFGGKLYLFWQANDPGNRIYYAASADGVTWPGGSTINDRDSTPASPSVSVFNNKMYLFWRANDSGQRIYHTSSSDGVYWPHGTVINDWDYTPEAPASCVFNNQLYVFWKGGDSCIYCSASTAG